MDIQTIATIFIKVLKLVINFIILMLYRYGGKQGFLGVGGTWNLYEVKSADAEIIASGVFVGFFIYTSVILISYCFGTTKHKYSAVDIIMNVSGTILFTAVGGIALHYWVGFQDENHYVGISQEKQIGLALGSLSVVEAAIYLLDTVLSCIHIAHKHAIA